MKKGLLIGIIIGVLILGGVGFLVLNSEKEISCVNYDGDEESCLLYEECKWTSDENICEPIDMIEEDDEDDEEDLRAGFVSELEEGLLDTTSNEICKKLPLTDGLSQEALSTLAPSSRYTCLATVNNNPEFCELIEIDNEEDIEAKNEKNMCLAHANEDSSYCEKVEGQDSKHTCYFMLAVSSENVNFCKDINYLETAQENQEEKLRCYYGFISNLYQWDESDEIKTEYCNEFPSGEDERGACFALKARDISMCGNDPECLTHFEQPLSFCDDRPNFVSCIKDRAKTNEDISICDMLSQPDRDVCVGVYCTHIELDVNICATIEDIQVRQEFYAELAMNLGNR